MLCIGWACEREKTMPTMMANVLFCPSLGPMSPIHIGFPIQAPCFAGGSAEILTHSIAHAAKQGHGMRRPQVAGLCDP